MLTQGAVVGVSVVQTVNLLAAVSTLLLLVLNKGFMDSRHFTIYKQLTTTTYIVILLTQEVAHEDIVTSIQNHFTVHTL